MLETLRSPRGRIAFGAATSAALVALVLLVDKSMATFIPVLLLPIWISLIRPEDAHLHRGLLRSLLALGVATFVAGIVLFFFVR